MLFVPNEIKPLAQPEEFKSFLGSNFVYVEDFDIFDTLKRIDTAPDSSICDQPGRNRRQELRQAALSKWFSLKFSKIGFPEVNSNILSIRRKFLVDMSTSEKPILVKDEIGMPTQQEVEGAEKNFFWLDASLLQTITLDSRSNYGSRSVRIAAEQVKVGRKNLVISVNAMFPGRHPAQITELSNKFKKIAYGAISELYGNTLAAFALEEKMGTYWNPLTLRAAWVPVNVEVQSAPAVADRDPALLAEFLGRQYLIGTWTDPVSDDRMLETLLQEFSS